LSRNTNSAEKRRNAFFLILVVVGIIAGGIIGFDSGMRWERMQNIDANIDFSVFTKGNIDSFCVQHGYQNGWAECNGLDFGVTCHRDTDLGYTKYQCFDLKEFYIFNGGASGGAGAGR
jgi:hypothetical protein